MTKQPITPLELRIKAFEPPYKTETEARIGQLLGRQGILFFYEQRTLVLNGSSYEIRKPAFTLPEYNGLVVDVTRPRTSAGDQTTTHGQEAVYRANAIPALFVHARDLTAPQWSDRLISRIRQAGEEALQYERPDDRYGAAPAYK